MTLSYTSLVSRVVFPLHEWLKGHHTYRVRRDLERTQWLSLEEIEILRVRRLRSLLRYVHEKIPYYQRIFRERKFHWSSVTTTGDLARLPFLTKSLIRRNIAELKGPDDKDLSRFNTGGSTGQPLVFYISKERVSHDVAAKWRATRWWGLDLGDKEIVVWGSPIELSAQDKLRTWRDRLFRTRLLPAFEMSEAKLDEFLSIIRESKPTMLFGYPSALCLIARHAQARGARLDDLGIKVAFVTAEQLYEHQRSLIARTYGCKVANGYGGRDAGFIAHECPRGGMHITAEDIILEIVDDDGNVVPAGESGEVVITHLATREFPFIRYRTGDLAALDDESCVCGRQLPMLKEIHGRTTDFIVAEDGTIMHALALIYVIRDVEGVEDFKIVQEDDTHTRVQLVTGHGFSEESMDRIREGISSRLGAGIKVSIELMERIPPEGSGKHRHVTSRVAPQIKMD